MKMVGAHSLDQLRSMPASKLLKATAQKGSPRFRVDVDGYFLPEQPVKIFSEGKQAHVSLLLGWNSEESSWQAFLKGRQPTPKNFTQRVKKVYGDHAKKILELFPHSSRKQAKQSATRLASDRFTVFSTWKWAELQSKTGGHPVYRYYYTQPRPEKRDTSDNNSYAYGAVHSAEIEYVLGNLPTNRVYNWQPVDYKISHIFQNYVSNFVKYGNPNGLGLPVWIPLNKTRKHYVMQIGAKTYLRSSNQRKQLLYLDKLYYPKR
jgi:para-nitrobenzyl esterase